MAVVETWVAKERQYKIHYDAKSMSIRTVYKFMNGMCCWCGQACAEPPVDSWILYNCCSRECFNLAGEAFERGEMGNDAKEEAKPWDQRGIISRVVCDVCGASNGVVVPSGIRTIPCYDCGAETAQVLGF